MRHIFAAIILGLNCNPDGGCNSDYPYCCHGQCQKSPCGNAGQP